MRLIIALLLLLHSVFVSSYLYFSPLRASRVAARQRDSDKPQFAFRRSYEDKDGDDDDDEPPDISTTTEEFRQKLDSKASTTSFGPGRGRSAPLIRPAFGAKKSSGGKDGDQKNMAKVYVCTNCGSEYVQWQGRCGTCMEWNTIQEFAAPRGGGSRSRPVFGKSNIQTSSFIKTGSSWLDGIDGDGGMSGRGAGGPVRVTDVYQEIVRDKGKSGTDNSSHFTTESRLSIPDDEEMNTVLGGGIMPGSIVLLGGDPGVGKSTLLLQLAGGIASVADRSLQYQGIGMGPPVPSPTTQSESTEDEKKQKKHQNDIGPVLYISGEENSNQIASRALRLGIVDPEMLLWCETDADIIADTVANSMYGPPLAFGTEEEDTNNKPPLSRSPSLVIIDSIQTMLCDSGGSSSAGGITQVRECVGLFLRLAKSTGVPIILVGHVTKSGDVAGPRTVEHMVDSVLYLEAGALIDGGTSSLRVLRAAKNRFGSSEEVGVYEMSSGGRLVPVSDPSSYFLSNRIEHADSEGCAVSIVLEGIRTMAVEVQALVALSGGSGGYSGRRVVDGISNSRLLLILAVLQKRYGISFGHRHDVYLNVVGGFQLDKGSKSGGGSDLAVAIAAVSSLVGIPCRSDTCFVGEVGLLGEIRPVHALEKRISEAKRMGFSRIVTPTFGDKNNRYGPREVSKGGITQIMCDNVLEAINCGLVKKLPTKSTISGPKLKRRNKSSTQNDAMWNNDDIILDDAEDDFFE
ncbi:hypothetical protein ACHAWT_010953 [Skeletonema menzelii]